MKKLWPIVIICISALAGLIDASLVHLKEIASKTDPTAFQNCSINAVLNCTSVAASSYSHLFGIPVSQLGIYFYEAALVIALIILLGWKPPRIATLGITAITVLGCIFSFYLLYMSYFGVGALCLYCLVSNLTTLLVTVFWLVYALPQLKAKS